MIVLINYFNNQVKIFDNIISINDANDKDYILIDSFENNIIIPRLNVEYMLIDNFESITG
jgi:hypothetical protein